MLRQTISAIKTEVWDWRMGHTTPQMSWNANSDSSRTLFVNVQIACNLTVDVFREFSGPICTCEHFQLWSEKWWSELPSVKACKVNTWYCIADFVYLLELNLIPRWNGFFMQGDFLTGPPLKIFTITRVYSWIRLCRLLFAPFLFRTSGFSQSSQSSWLDLV